MGNVLISTKNPPAVRSNRFYTKAQGLEDGRSRRYSGLVQTHRTDPIVTVRHMDTSGLPTTAIVGGGPWSERSQPVPTTGSRRQNRIVDVRHALPNGSFTLHVPLLGSRPPATDILIARSVLHRLCVPRADVAQFDTRTDTSLRPWIRKIPRIRTHVAIGRRKSLSKPSIYRREMEFMPIRSEHQSHGK